MKEKFSILAICGSTRHESVNLKFIQAFAREAGVFLEVRLFEGLAGLPPFNPDLEGATIPAAVVAFRRQIQEASGVLICTPEYAMGVPGTLKNALDWTVASSDFSGKPVALITAASLGNKAHASLLGTLQVIGAAIGEDTALLISFARTKINSDSRITDGATLEGIRELISSFHQKLQPIAGQ